MSAQPVVLCRPPGLGIPVSPSTRSLGLPTLQSCAMSPPNYVPTNTNRRAGRGKIASSVL